MDGYSNGRASGREENIFKPGEKEMIVGSRVKHEVRY
jgi:hypothetical protein